MRKTRPCCPFIKLQKVIMTHIYMSDNEEVTTMTPIIEDRQ